MGRTKKYRNNAEKQLAYRQRKLTENWSDELISKVNLLRKNARYIAENTPCKPRIEVYKRMDGTKSYKLLKFVWEWLRIDEQTFEAIRPELTLVSKSFDTEIYMF